MRISLTLFGQWPLTKNFSLPVNMTAINLMDNAFLTSTQKEQSLKDILYDGALFHLLKKLDYTILLMVQCDRESCEYNLLQSFKDDVDIFIEFNTFEES